LSKSFSEVTLHPAEVSPAHSQGRLSRPASRSNLTRISPEAEVLNRSASHTLDALVQKTPEAGKNGIRDDRHPSRGVPAASPAKKNVATTLDEEAFALVIDRIAANIEGLKQEHESFDPVLNGTLSPKSGTGKRGLRAVGKDLSTEEMEQLAERLAIYKMARKVEPELPPLSREALPDSPGPAFVDKTMIWANVMPDAVQCCIPQRVKERRIEARERRCAREKLYASTRENAIDSLCQQYAADLERKRRQAESAVALRRAASQKEHSKAEFPMDKWLTLCVTIGFLKRNFEDLKMQKMSPEERTEYISSLQKSGKKMSNTKWASDAMEDEKQKKQILRVLEDPFNFHKIKFLAKFVQKQKQIRERRHDAKTMFATLTSWKFFGRVYHSFKRIPAAVKRVQRWWRRVRTHLASVRAKVSQRWERLERAELTKKLQADIDFGRPASHHERGDERKKRMPMTPSKLSLEDKVEISMMHEDLRDRVIAHELRSRRHRLLPQLAMWKEELEEWKQEQKAWEEQKAAHRSMDIEAPILEEFRWPPFKPSYLFPEKAAKEEGDQEIIALIRAARAHKGKGGWTAIGKQDTSASGRAQAEQKSEARPFGEADDRELARWGADPAAMPGLTVVHAEGGIRFPVPC